MNEEQKSAFDAVEKINDELFIKYDKLNTEDGFKDWLSIMPELCITFCNGKISISLSIPSENYLPEIYLFNSEQDDRIYYKKSDKYETFYKFIKRKFIEIKKEIYEIKL